MHDMAARPRAHDSFVTIAIRTDHDGPVTIVPDGPSPRAMSNNCNVQ